MAVSLFTVRARRTRILSLETKASSEDMAEIAMAAMVVLKQEKSELWLSKCLRDERVIDDQRCSLENTQSTGINTGSCQIFIGTVFDRLSQI